MKSLEHFDSGEQRLMAMASRRGMPISGAMELLPLCNLNCKMCYVRLSRGEMEAIGRLRTGAEWLALGAEMARAGVLFLQLTGGEPLLHPDFREIYMGLKKLGMILTVNTNGTLIDEDWADFFAANKPRRLNITLYGGSRETYERQCGSADGFDRVVKAVGLLRERNVDVKFSASLTPQVRADLEEMGRIARELDVPLHVDPYMTPASRERHRPFDEQSRLSPEDAADASLNFLRAVKSAEEFEASRQAVLAQIDSFVQEPLVPAISGCLAGRCAFTVSWLGRLQPCEILTEPAVHVFETGFEAGWNQVRDAFADVRYCADCSACRLRPLCSTCPAACMEETGDYMKKPEYLCRYAARYEKLLRQEDGHDQ
ncbi:MAG: radical SAM protein [Oscillospiraceae bacterium]|nr:radical SAM protein [Oscillospiraceae bacterium]